MVLVLLSALACLLPASEQPLYDLRAAVELRPTAVDYRWDDGAGRSGEDRFTRAWGVAVGWRGGFGRPGGTHQLLAGAELAAAQDDLADGRRQALVPRLELGWAAALGERWLVGAAPVAGLGLARLRLAPPASAPLELRGPALELGLRAGLRLRLDRHWSLGAEGGWLWGRDRLVGDGTVLELRRSGPWLGLALAWTVDPRPRSFE
ncbi:MAG: hypothetical protein L6R48_17720 [Planctomycetes bacterium]|nr:hypothetical protein [Planctomycetota bacterium]